MFYSYVMGMDDSILELRQQIFIVVRDRNNYQISFSKEKAQAWKSFIKQHLKVGYWNNLLYSKNKCDYAIPREYCYCCGGHFKFHYEIMLGVKLKLIEIVTSPHDPDSDEPCVFRYEMKKIAPVMNMVYNFV